MKYQQTSITTGSWLKASEIESGAKCKIVSETKPIPSIFQDKNGNVKNQDVAKVRFEGKEEPVNVSLNRATLNSLISAFGDDSVNWQNKVLTAETEKVRVSGKAVTVLYLVPEGYKKIDDDNGYALIIKESVEGEGNQSDDTEDINPNDIPF